MLEPDYFTRRRQLGNFYVNIPQPPPPVPTGPHHSYLNYSSPSHESFSPPQARKRSRIRQLKRSSTLVTQPLSIYPLKIITKAKSESRGTINQGEMKLQFSQFGKMKGEYERAYLGTTGTRIPFIRHNTQ